MVSNDYEHYILFNMLVHLSLGPLGISRTAGMNRLEDSALLKEPRGKFGPNKLEFLAMKALLFTSLEFV